MKRILLISILVIAIFLFAFFTFAQADSVEYINFSKPVEYSVAIGGEFPGTVADFKVDNSLLKIDYNFNKTGKYCQAIFNLGESALDSATGISFVAKGVKGEGIIFRLNDADGECYQANITIESDDFQEYTFNFADLEKGQHWGGSGNAKLDFPIGSFGIGPEKHSLDTGILYLKNVSFITFDKKALNAELVNLGLKRINLELETNRPGNLYYFGEDTKAKIVLKNNILPILNVNVDLDFYNVNGKKLKSSKISFNSDKNKTFELYKTKGYVEVKYKATINNKVTKEGSFYYGIIPDNSKIMAGKTSYFGVNCHFNQGWDPMFAKIVKRAGISWVRDGEASLEDKAYPICKANGIQYMPCFTGMQDTSYKYITEEIEKGKSVHDKWDFSKLIGHYGEYAKKYGDYVFVYDMLNEPNNMGWTKFGGDWSGGDWVDVFTQWSQQISKQVRDNDSDAQILWEDMDNNLWSDQYLKYGVKGSDLDIISQHPYNLHRSNPLPENQGFRETNKRFWERNKENNLNWRLIDGEVGFPSYIFDDKTPGMFYTGYALDLQPALIVRMYVMHLTSGVDRIFYYDFRNDGWVINNPEHNFGLVLNDGNPKPAICGYANMVNQIEGVKWTGRIDKNNDNIHIYGYNNREGLKSICAWALESETVSIDTQAKSVNLIDLYGNVTKLTPKSGKITLKLNEYPVYVVGL